MTDHTAKQAKQSCPECGALPHRPHEPECPTLVPVVVHEDGSPATLDDLVTDDWPDLAVEIARAGRLEVTRAEEQAARWAQWAQQVHQLIEDIPTVGPDPRYVADDGIEAFDLPFHVGVDDAVRMEKFLARVLRDADAVTCAWRRAAVDVQARAHAALRACDADPEHFVTLGGGESHG